jgi:formylglycine-generating enzyme required for sulfatase activity
MRRPATKIVVAAAVLGAALIAVAGVRAALRRGASEAASGDALPCGAGFLRRATRCCPSVDPASPLREGSCASPPHPAACPAPLVPTARGCDAPERAVVRIPATRVLIGPSDWEAEGRVRARTVTAGRFDLDRFEVTVGRVQCAGCPPSLAARLADQDAARAASGVTLDEARAVCAARGGRLPTEDEWIVAAAGDRPRRYPWGDTGAVCRRAAWGLRSGPCASGARGPDTVGAHPDGVSPLGLHDLAGNVAEWVEAGGACDDGGACTGVVRGGSFETELATELRTWVRREVPARAREPSVGFRCAYDAR